MPLAWRLRPSVNDSRSLRLRYGLVTAALSKLTATALQALAGPAVFRTLGGEALADLVYITSVTNWITVSTIGLTPGLTVRTAIALAKNEHDAPFALLQSALTPVLCATVLTATVAAGSLMVYEGGTATLGTCLVLALTVLIAVQTVTAVIDAVQAGYQEHYVLNLRTAFANAVGVLCLALIGVTGVSVPLVLFATYAPATVAKVWNSANFIVARGWMWPRPGSIRSGETQELLREGSVFFLGSGIGAYLANTAPVLLVAKQHDLAVAVPFAALMNGLLLLFGPFSTALAPLWPAISDGRGRKDDRWVKNAFWRTMLSAGAAAVLVLVALASAGPAVFRAWYGPNVGVDPPSAAAAGVYFACLVLEYVLFTYLGGFGEVRRAALTYLFRAIATFGAAVICVLSRQRADTMFLLFAGTCFLFGIAPLGRYVYMSMAQTARHATARE